jgi:hypothetical protein
MTPLELYKLLPQKNCGKCTASSCMSFAVQYLRRMIPIHECVELDEEAQKSIESREKGPGDWKERRLDELMAESKGWDLAAIADTVGAEKKGDAIEIRYMGRDVMFNLNGFDPPLDTMSSLLVLMYLKKAGKGPVSGQWIAFRELKDGIIRSETFHSACEMQIAGMFQHDPDGVINALKSMNAEEAVGYSADYSFRTNVLPHIPFLVLLRSPDEEFAADCRILLDRNATEFLDIEALLYLGMAFTANVRALCRRQGMTGR